MKRIQNLSFIVAVLCALSGSAASLSHAQEGISGGLPVTSGTYTPTLTNSANLSASTSFVFQYMRVGNVVTVSGKVEIDPTTTSTLTTLGISLPIASNLTDGAQCRGTGACGTIAGQSAAITGDTTNDRAQMQWIAVDVTNQPMSVIFTYIIL